MNGEAIALSSVNHVLQLAKDLGIQFSIVGDNLKIRLPEGGISSEVIESIKYHKPAIIAAIKEGLEEGSNSNSVKLTHISNKQNIPLTDLQESMWLAERMSDTVGLLNYCSVTRIDKEPNLQALEYAYAKILERHLPLRASIIEQPNGKKYQSEIMSYSSAVEYVDFSGNADAFSTYLKRTARTEFNFEYGPKLALHLVRISEDDFRLILVMHHIATDGWSVGLLMEEIPFFYNQYLDVHGKSLPDIAVDYFDYAIWADKQRENGALEKGLQYWEQRLLEAPVIHSIPTDFQRPNALSFGVEYYYQKMPLEDLRDIQGFASKQGVTLYSVLLSVYLVLLHKYSAEKHFVIGTSVANRTQEELSPLVGLFTNTLPMAFALDQTQTFSQLVASVQKAYLADIEYQDIPLDRIIKRLKHDAMTFSYNPLVQIAFFVQNNDFTEFDFQGLNCSTTFVKTQVSLFDLTLSATEFPDSLELEWTYSLDLFTLDTVVRMCGHYTSLLKQLIRDANKPLSAVQMLTPKQIAEFNNSWNDTYLQLPEKACFFHLFEQQVKQQPEARALVMGNLEVSYRELNELSNRIAHYLIGNYGIHTEALFGVCIGRSVEMVATMLGIMKAGGAYVPLDPEYPAKRIKDIIEDAGVTAIFTTSKIAREIEIEEARLICCDDEGVRLEIDKCLVENPPLSLSQSHLAYVIYTSGSTGKPKGVMIEHHALLNFLLSMKLVPGFSENDRLLSVTSISFDIHTLEIFLPLICGGLVVLTNKEDQANPQALISLIDNHSITVMQATPVTWEMLTDAGWQPRHNIKVLCGGEALSEKLREKLILHKQIELWNMYGPTETCVWSSVRKLADKVMIGKPIHNTSFHILDVNRMPVPEGVPGELCIGGAGLARGYINRPELTDEVFIQYSDNGENIRIYRTGDIVKYGAREDIIFLGRKDNQIKTRGFRIEPGEVEKHIEATGLVEKAIVMANKEIASSPILTAYVIYKRKNDENETLLRQAIKANLPEYMIPAVIVGVEQYPLTPNGKIDRKQLLTIKSVSPKGRKSLPETPIQKKICQLWSRILHVEESQIGLDDNFYALGGDSIIALRFIDLAKRHGLAITLQNFVTGQTVRDISLSATRVALSGNQTKAQFYTGEALLTADQKSLFQVEKIYTNFTTNGIVELPEKFDLEIFKKALAMTAETHDALRSRFSKVENQWKLQIVDFIDTDVVLNLKLSTGWDDQGAREEVRKYLTAIQNKLDLFSGPHYQFALIESTDNIKKLLFTINHMVADAYSLGVFLEDLSSAYEMIRNGDTESSLPTVPPINLWSRAINDYYNSREVKDHLSYWRGLPWHTYRLFPVDFPDVDREIEAVHSTKTAIVETLSEEHTSYLKTLVHQKLGISPAEFIVALLAKTFHDHLDYKSFYLHLWDSGRPFLQGMKLASEDQLLDVSHVISPLLLPKFLFLSKIDELDIFSHIKSVSRQISEIPLEGRGYKMLRYGCDDTEINEQMTQFPEPDIWLNFLGSADFAKTSPDERAVDLLKISPYSTYVDIVTQSGDAPLGRSILLPWMIREGKLLMIWEYSLALNNTSTIERLSKVFRDLIIDTLEKVAAETESRLSNRDDAPNSSISKTKTQQIEAHGQVGREYV